MRPRLVVVLAAARRLAHPSEVSLLQGDPAAPTAVPSTAVETTAYSEATPSRSNGVSVFTSSPVPKTTMDAEVREIGGDLANRRVALEYIFRHLLARHSARSRRSLREMQAEVPCILPHPPRCGSNGMERAYSTASLFEIRSVAR